MSFFGAQKKCACQKLQSLRGPLLQTMHACGHLLCCWGKTLAHLFEHFQHVRVSSCLNARRGADALQDSIRAIVYFCTAALSVGYTLQPFLHLRLLFTHCTCRSSQETRSCTSSTLATTCPRRRVRSTLCCVRMTSSAKLERLRAGCRGSQL